MAHSNANLETKVDSTARPALVGDASIASSSLAVSRIIAPWYRTSIGQEMVVFDVSDPDMPLNVDLIEPAQCFPVWGGKRGLQERTAGEGDKQTHGASSPGVDEFQTRNAL